MYHILCSATRRIVIDRKELNKRMLSASHRPEESPLPLEKEHICQLLDVVPIPILLTSEVERDGVIQSLHVYVNRRFREVLGYTVDDIPDMQAWYATVYPDPFYREEVLAASERAVSESVRYDRPRTRTMSRVRCKDGTDHWFEIIDEPRNTPTDRWHVVAFLEVTELKAVQAELDYLSQTDTLTQLLNRRGLLQHLERELARTQRTGKSFCLVVCDLDHFKHINDTYGHECGDLVLRDVAALLRSTLREHDIVARWGGEEFCLILPETDVAGALGVVERVQSVVTACVIVYQSAAITPTLTFGISEYTPRATATDLIRHADIAMYYGKTHGRNCVTTYSTAVDRSPDWGSR